MKAPLCFLALFLCLAIPAARAQSNYETPYQFTTLAGVSSIGATDGPGAQARFRYATALVVDPTGAVYVTDSANATIRRIAPDGQVSTFTGKVSEQRSVDGSLAEARFNRPRSIARDAAGNLYVTENNAVRKISAAGTVTTLAGASGTDGTYDGKGRDAAFGEVLMVATSADGTVYVCDALHQTIRRIMPDGTVTTLAGRAGFRGEDDGTGSAARFDFPSSITVTPAGMILVTDRGLRQITPEGVVTTLEPRPFNAISSDTAGNLYLNGPNGLERRSADGTLSPLLNLRATHGDGERLFQTQSHSSAKFVALATDPAGNLYFLDGNAVRKLSLSGTVATVAGLPLFEALGTADGTGQAARFGDRLRLARAPGGELYVLDTVNHTVRKVTPAGVVTTFAGSPGVAGSSDGVGSTARFSSPEGIAVDASGNVYVSDTGNHTVRKITPTGVVSTFAGLAGSPGVADGVGSAARLTEPQQLAFSPQGVLYVLELDAIRRIAPDGTVTTLELGFDPWLSPNDQGLAFTNDGRLFVANRHEILEISPVNGAVLQRFAGSPGDLNSPAQIFGGDGFRDSAHFYDVEGLTFDSAGIMWVADSGDNTVRRITTTGVTTTLAGLAGLVAQTFHFEPFDAGYAHADGIGRDARFTHPSSIVRDPNGTLYVTEAGAIRKGQPAGLPTISTQPASLTVQAGASAQFSVTADGTPAPTYQWVFNGTALTGAAGSSLSLASARTADAGDYTVVVTNSQGSVTSSKATLTVTAATNPPPPPAPPATSGDGGGGAPSAWFTGALALLTGLRALRIYIRRTP